jgi:hypothetical protein
MASSSSSTTGEARMNQHLMRSASLLATALLSLGLSACTFDYLNNLDRVTLAGGNAVQSNLEQETINPTGKRSYKTTGLGADGGVMPKDSSVSAAPPAPKTGA